MDEIIQIDICCQCGDMKILDIWIPFPRDHTDALTILELLVQDTINRLEVWKIICPDCIEESHAKTR